MYWRVRMRREREFSYREDSQAFYHKACKLRSSHLPPKFDVLLTSYEYPSMDSALLSSIPWSVLVIDEAHRLKNQQSLVSRPKYSTICALKSFLPLLYELYRAAKSTGFGMFNLLVF